MFTKVIFAAALVASASGTLRALILDVCCSTLFLALHATHFPVSAFS
jgi:hypothetical protein